MAFFTRPSGCIKRSRCVCYLSLALVILAFFLSPGQAKVHLLSTEANLKSTLPYLVHTHSEADSKAILLEIKNVEDELRDIRGVSRYFQSPYLTAMLPMVALQKMEYEKEFAQAVPVYKELQLDPFENLVHSVDKAAAIYVNRLGGGEYDSQFDLIVPKDPRLVNQRWLELKDQIAKEIGPLTPLEDNASKNWVNSAQTVQELMDDAQIAAVALKSLSLEVVSGFQDVKAEFGLNDEHIVKSQRSLQEKVERYGVNKGLSEKDSVAVIIDAVRGTLIAKSIPELTSLIDTFKKEANALGWELVLSNYWDTQRPFGYVGIHAKIRIPIHQSGSQEVRWILSEMQFHLAVINDGTSDGLKERQHIIYTFLRNPYNDGTIIEKYTSASQLLYIAAFEEILENFKMNQQSHLASSR